jgi:hypothetical protein
VALLRAGDEAGVRALIAAAQDATQAVISSRM